MEVQARESGTSRTNRKESEMPTATTIATTTITATFTKWNNKWSIRVPSDQATIGAKVTIRKRNGEEKEATITAIVKKFDDNAICDFAETNPQPRRHRPARPSTGWSRYRRSYSAGCPVCGEDFGAMWDGKRCDECGHHA